MSDEILREIRSLRETLASIERRLTELERQVEHRATAPSAPPKPTPAEAQRPAAAPVIHAVPAAPPRPAEPAPSVKESAAVSASAPRCQRHPDRAIQWHCATCQAPLCPDCGGVAFQGRVMCRKCDDAASVSPAAVLMPRERKKREGGETFETKVGRYWLNRIGITSLVLGIVFFILYTFQYFGPAMKIATGVLASLGLLGLGLRLERRANLQWYARGLIGGGWALLYFTTYAMHHIPEVRILNAAWLDLCLLMAVAAGAVWHSLKYRSETITVLALLLGFVTTSISQVTYFTLLSSALLVAALAWLVVRMRWNRLYLYGVIASYATHLLWIAPQIARSRMVALHVGSVAEAAFWLNAGFLALYWVAYNVALFALEEGALDPAIGPRPWPGAPRVHPGTREGGMSPPMGRRVWGAPDLPVGLHRRNALLTATLVNAACFLYGVLSGMDRVYPEWRYLFALAVGACYLGSDWLGPRKRLPTVTAAHTLVGLSLLALAVPLKASGRWFSFWWMIEMMLVLWIGLRRNRWPYRIFAGALAGLIMARLLLLDLWTTLPVAVFGWPVPWRLVIGGFGVGSLGLAAMGYRSARFRDALRPAEAHAFHLYFAAAAALVWMLMWLEAAPRWVPVAWAAEAAATVLLGFRLKDPVVRAIGGVGFAVTGLNLLSVLGSWDAWVTACVIAIVYGVSRLYRVMSTGPAAARESVWQGAYALAAALLLTLLLGFEVDPQWVSLAWLLEIAALVTLGALLRDNSVRLFSLGFAVVALAQVLFSNMYLQGYRPYPPVVILGMAIPWRVFIGLIGIAAFGAPAVWYRLPRAQAQLRPFESQGFHVYVFAAAFLMWMLVWREARAAWVPALWAAEAAGMVLLGFGLQDRLLRLAGAVGCGVTALRLLGYVGEWHLWATALVVAMWYGMSARYRARAVPESEGVERWCRHGYAVAASLVLTVLLSTEIDRHWVSVAWALEGLALVATGFGLRDKVFRVSGLSVFALLVLRVLFVDLAGAETIYRILSFIAAGAMLLAASFAYGRFAGKASPKQEKP